MAPTPAAMALLFHPKKKDGVVLNPVAQPKKKKVLTPLPNAVAPEPIKQDEPVSLPPDSLDYPCREYQLVTASTGGWDYDVMKFESRSSKVDPRTWEQPVKLNRKEPRRHESGVSSEGPQAVGPMLGPDGKPVIGMDGRMVMVDAEGRPIHNNQNRGQDGGGRGGGRGRGGRKFQKKTRQVFLVPEETRQLRREERFPWVLEDATGQETWHATMEEVSKSDTHAMFMPMADGSFQFVPVHRWYKYQKKPSHKVLTLEEAEKLMGQMQKNKDPERWLLRNRNGQAPSAATAAIFKTESGAGASGSGGGGASSLGPGGRRLRAVDSGANDLFGDDDDDDAGARRRREREMGGDGDIDEVDFEDEFADDEQTMEADDKEDDDAKELDRRLQREYDAANKAREGNEESDDDDEQELSKAGKGLQKLMRKLEKTMDEDSGDERNPYASSEEESEEEEVPPTQEGPAVQPQPPTGSQTPKDMKAPTATPPSLNGRPGSGSRAASPSAPTMGGHSMVAKRATSPKIPRPKNAASRATSPLAGSLSSRTSPAASRAGSPPAPSGSGAQKRKATEDGSIPPKPKKQRPAGELNAQKLIDWLEKTEKASTRDCIAAFAGYTHNEEAKKLFTRLVKEVAILKGGFLVLRPGAREAAAAAAAS